MIDLLEQVIKVQNKSDERMIEIEEKRLRMEEQQLKRETVQQRKRVLNADDEDVADGPRDAPLTTPTSLSQHRMHNDPSSPSRLFACNFGTEDYSSFTRSFENDK